jgi:hypothetical protein
VPVQELSWWKRAILAWMQGATGLRETTPGARQAFNFPEPVRLPPKAAR